jgi:hypothetical protein
MSTCHLFTSAPVDDCWKREICAGDVIVDLSVDGLFGQGQQRQLAGIQFERASVADAQIHEQALRLYQEWMVRALTDADPGLPSVRHLLIYRDRFSLAWMLKTAGKHYQNYRLPRLVQQYAWIQQSENAEFVAELLIRCERVQIWDDDSLVGPTLRPAIERARRSPHRQIEYQYVDLQGADIERPYGWRDRHFGGELVDKLRHLPRGLRKAIRSSGASSRRGSNEDQEGSHQVDVVLSTRLNSWEETFDSETGEAKYWNRYMSGIYERLEARGLRVAWLPAPVFPGERETFHEISRQQGDQRWTFQGALPLSQKLRIAADLADLILRYLRYRHRIIGHERFGLGELDLSLWIVRDIDQLLPGRAFHLISFHEDQRRALASLRPSVVLYKNELFPPGLALKATNISGVEYWGIQHGTIPTQHWQYRHPPDLVAPSVETQARDYTRYFPYPDKFLTYGPSVNELMTTTGYPSERLCEVGSLRHDEWFERVEQLSGGAELDCRASTGLPLDKKVLLICAQFPQDVPDWIERTVRAVEQLNLDAHIAVKEHWRFPIASLVRTTFERLEWKEWSFHQTNLFDLLLAADIQLTSNSTTGLEACLLKTPLICLEPETQGALNPYVAGRIALPAANIDDMKSAISTSLGKDYFESWLEERTKYLEQHMTNATVPAAEAVTAMVKSEMSSQRSRNHTRLRDA